MQRTEQSENQVGCQKSLANVLKKRPPVCSDDEEMTDHEQVDQVMMSMGPPTQVDTSSIKLATQTNDSEIMRMIQQYL